MTFLASSATVACCLAFATLAVAQTTVSIPCAADNTLYESATGDLSNGAGIGVFVGLNSSGLKRRGLLRFDVAAAIPVGAKVITVRLDLNVSNSPVSVAEPITGHRLLQSWGEGTSVASGGGGNGGVATTGDATWLHRFWNTQTWTTAGGDFAATPSWTASMPASGVFSSQPSRQAVTDVQGWLDAPASNFGWLLKGGETILQSTHRIDSRESTGVRPTLVVGYLLPGQNGTFGTGCSAPSGTLATAWSGVPLGGATMQILQAAAPPLSVGAVFFALALDPAGTPLLPGCTVWLPPGELIPGPAFVTDAAGAAVTPFVVPVGFPGQVVACQAAVLAPTPLGFTAGNAAVTVLQ